MPKGQTPKINGSIVNVPVNISEICNQLSHEGNIEKIILVN